MSKSKKFTFYGRDLFEILAIGISIWFLFHPQPYNILFIIVLATPIIGILRNGWRRPSIASLVKVMYDDEGFDDYDVSDFIDIPAGVLFLRVLLDFRFSNYSDLIMPVLIAFTLILVILFLTHKPIVKSNKNKVIIYGYIFFNILLYSFAGVGGINSLYGNNIEGLYPVEIIEKENGKFGLHYFKVSEWRQKGGTPVEVNVDGYMYNRFNQNDTIFIANRVGFLGIAWYTVTWIEPGDN